MSKYTVVVAKRVGIQLPELVKFLARVSIPAAKRFRDEYAGIIDRLEDNPYQFPCDTDPNLPDGLYRKAVFARWYKVLFIVEDDTVYLDAVVDCRRSFDSYEL